MTDHYDQDKILGYVEGELSDDDRAAFEAVLADDHELRQLVSQMKLDREALRGLGTTRAPVGLIDQVIQTNERSALLGDPAAPEPLPLTTPVNRWKFRRALAYGSIAAVVIISFGFVFQTLIPHGFLNRGTQVAQHDPGNGPADTAAPDVGSGVALLDEDSAYDTLDARSLGRQRTNESADAPEPASVVAKNELGPAVAEEMDRLGAADSISAERDAVALNSEPVADTEIIVGAELARSEMALGEKGVAAGTAGAFADASPLADDGHAKESEAPMSGVELEGNTEASLALAESTDGTDTSRFKKEVLADAFAGYGVQPGDTPTQLVVNSTSPTQARRDLRDWALANSVRLVEEATPEIRLSQDTGGRAVGYAETGDSVRSGGAGGIVGLGLAGQASNDKLDDTSDSLARASQQSPDATFYGKATTDTAGTSYVVLIDRDQVPELLTYLNRAQGQHAELVGEPLEALNYEARADTVGVGSSNARTDAYGLDEAETEGLASLDPQEDEPAERAEAEEADDAPKATANRLVDTESGWFNGSNAPTVRGLAVTPSGPAKTRRSETREVPAEREQQDQPQSDAAESDTQADRAVENKEQTDNGTSRRPDYFDWSRLLEPRRRTASPANEPAAAESAEEIVEDTTHDTRLRLEVIIQQTADEASSPEAGEE